METLLSEFSDDMMKSATTHSPDEVVSGERGGKSYRLARGAVLTHITTHGMHHRAQMLNMLRQLGVAPLPKSDVISWVMAADQA